MLLLGGDFGLPGVKTSFGMNKTATSLHMSTWQYRQTTTMTAATTKNILCSFCVTTKVRVGIGRIIALLTYLCSSLSMVAVDISVPGNLEGQLA